MTEQRTDDQNRNASRVLKAYIGLALLAAFVTIRLSLLPEPSDELSLEGHAGGYAVGNIRNSIAKRAGFDQHLSCLPNRAAEDPDLRRITLALVALENYARPKGARWLEFKIARSIGALSGRTPDLSLGVAQLRVSTARDIMGPPRLDDVEILSLLEDDCESVKIAFRYVERLAIKHASFCEPKRVIPGPALDEISRLQDIPAIRQLTHSRRSECASPIIREYNGQASLDGTRKTAWPDLYHEVASLTIYDLARRDKRELFRELKTEAQAAARAGDTRLVELIDRWMTRSLRK